MSFSSFHINKFITYRINAMRINDILTETRSDEGIVSDIGTGVGKAVGATARGVGAVAGGVRGAWDAAKQGFQAGRNLVGGGGSSAASNPDVQRAHDLRVQADQLDGGTSAQQNYAAPVASGGSSRVGRSGSGGQSTPYTGGAQNAAGTSSSNNAAAPTGPDPAALKTQKLQQALQHLSGPDVERIRGMLKKRAGIAEGIMSKIAGGLGKMGRGYVDAKSAYQKGRGGDMTPQEIDLAIASMTKEQAAELLQFFDTLHPAAAGGPADSGAPTTPATSTAPSSTAPAETTPKGAVFDKNNPEHVAAMAATTASEKEKNERDYPGSTTPEPTPPGGAAGAGAAGNGAAGTNTGSGFQAPGRVTPTNASYKLNMPKTPAATPATTTPPTGGKLTQAQQDAMKARLQGQRAAGKTTASQTGSGFKDYVGGSEEKMAGVDASGAPVFKKLQRESVAFSKFLGVHI
jgi:hypothetical protein